VFENCMVSIFRFYCSVNTTGWGWIILRLQGQAVNMLQRSEGFLASCGCNDKRFIQSMANYHHLEVPMTGVTVQSSSNPELRLKV